MFCGPEKEVEVMPMAVSFEDFRRAFGSGAELCLGHLEVVSRAGGIGAEMARL